MHITLLPLFHQLSLTLPTLMTQLFSFLSTLIRILADLTILSQCWIAWRAQGNFPGNSNQGEGEIALYQHQYHLKASSLFANRQTAPLLIVSLVHRSSVLYTIEYE